MSTASNRPVTLADKTEIYCYAVVDTAAPHPSEILVNTVCGVTGAVTGGWLTVEQATTLRDLLNTAMEQTR